MASGDIISVTINPDGWSADVTIEGWAGAQGSTNYNFGTPGSTDTSNFYITVTSEGYNDAGVLGTTVRTVYATQVVRQPFPNQSDLDEVDSGGNLVVRVALSDFIYDDDKDGGAGTSGTDPAVTLPAFWAGKVIGGIERTKAFNSNATNNSTLDYPRALGQWVQTIGAHRRVKSDFQLGFHARHAFGISVVRFTTSDQSANTDVQYVTEERKYQYSRSGLYGSYYIADLEIAQFDQGEVIDCQAVAYPVVGDADSIVDTSANGADDPVFQRADIVLMCDKDDLLDVFAYVDNTASGPGTNSATEATAQANPSETISDALAVSPSPNVIKIAGTGDNKYERWSDTVDAGYWIEVSQAAGSDAIVFIESGDRHRVDRLRFKEIPIRFDGSIQGRFGDPIIWVDNCEVTCSPSIGAGAMMSAGDNTNRTHYMVFTNCDISPNAAGNYTSFSNRRTAYIFEGCTEAGGFAGAFGSASFRMVASSVTWGISGVSGVNPIGQNDGCLFENNFIKKNRDENLLSLASSTVSIGQSVCGNIFERAFGAEGSSSCAVISGDNINSPCENMIICHNTILGQRTNAFYNDNGFALKTNHRLVGNVMSQHNTKHDVFSNDGSYTGAWSYMYGVGNQDSRYDGVQSVTFLPEFYGINVAFVPEDPISLGHSVPGDITFENDASDYGSGLGNGDYSPASGSPIENALSSGIRMMTYDLYGSEIPIDGTGNIGAVQAVSMPTVNNPPPIEGQDTVVLGMGKIKVSTTTGGKNITSFVFDDSNLAYSDKKLVLGGIPLTLFDRGDGMNVLGVYEVDATSNQLTVGNFVESDDTYVYFGVRFGIYTDGFNSLYVYGQSGADSTASDKIVWRGTPIAIASDASIICKKVTGDTDFIDNLYIGGMPLRYVSIDGRNYLAAIPI